MVQIDRQMLHPDAVRDADLYRQIHLHLVYKYMALERRGETEGKWMGESICIYSQTFISIIRGFWGQNLVRPTYMKYSQTSIIRTSIIRGFRDQNLVRLSTADNRGLTVISPTFNFRYTEGKV